MVSFDSHGHRMLEKEANTKETRTLKMGKEKIEMTRLNLWNQPCLVHPQNIIPLGKTNKNIFLKQNLR